MRQDIVKNEGNLLQQTCTMDLSFRVDFRNDPDKVPELQIKIELQQEVDALAPVPVTDAYDTGDLYKCELGMKRNTGRTHSAAGFHQHLVIGKYKTHNRRRRVWS